jgi:aldehyde:ferredoxin oxidoreductase
VPHGYNGKILRVDLKTNDIKIQEPPEKIYRGFLGGGALALYYLTKEMKPGIDPLGPENMLIFTTSVATGTQGMGFSRFTVAAKSPITGYFGEAEAGGWWGPELKFSGFDGIIIKGKSARPVYLWVHDGEAELRDASHLWGQMSRESQEMIRKELGDEKVRVALIGPGGEKLVRFACIVNELKHVNGRAGLGSVMGAKNLKAIAVRGDKSMSLNDPKAVREIVREVMEVYKKNPTPLGNLGTACYVLPLNQKGLLPTRNFITGSFDKAESISGEVMNDTILFKRGACYRCPVSCKREVKVDAPFNVDPIYGGPEYETIAALGSLCCIADLKALALGNQLCGAYTLDSISTGITIAFAMECFEKGIITTKDTGGIKLQFGDAESMLQMIELIGKREGFGNFLAEGVKVAAERLGKDAAKYAMHVKGLPVPMHEPRGKAGVALQYAISPTGADHCEAPHDVVFESETLLKPLMPLGIIEPVSSLDLSLRKVRIIVYLQQLFNMFNSIGICNFTVHPMGPMSLNYLVNYVNAVTGWNSSLWELMKVGERHTNMARIFNLREGLTPKDDSLPDRFFQPLEGGALKGKKIDPQEFQLALKTYYEMMGWNETGIPLRGKLEELSLEWLTR